MLRKMEKIYKALGDRTRLRILNMLMQKPMCVCEINQNLPYSQSTVSGHLKILRDADLIIDSKDGRFVVYHLNAEEVIVNELLQTIDRLFVQDENLQKERKKAIKADRFEICNG
jgi:ArsR family transcriptional regulator